jgi:hypothetical protein
MSAFLKLGGIDKVDAVGDLLDNLMHLCDRDPELGKFDAALDNAYCHYARETATDAEYARMQNSDPLRRGCPIRAPLRLSATGSFAFLAQSTPDLVGASDCSKPT